MSVLAYKVSGHADVQKPFSLAEMLKVAQLVKFGQERTANWAVPYLVRPCNFMAPI